MTLDELRFIEKVLVEFTIHKTERTEALRLINREINLKVMDPRKGDEVKNG